MSESLEWKTTKELKELCQQKGLDTAGTKQDLIARLRSKHIDPPAGPDSQIAEREDITLLLQDERHSVRAEAARRLGERESKQAVRFLIMALEDGSSRVRREAASPLGSIGDKSAIPALEKALKKQWQEEKELWEKEGEEPDDCGAMRVALWELGVPYTRIKNIVPLKMFAPIEDLLYPDPKNPRAHQEATSVLNVPQDIQQTARAMSHWADAYTYIYLEKTKQI